MQENNNADLRSQECLVPKIEDMTSKVYVHFSQKTSAPTTYHEGTVG